MKQAPRTLLPAATAAPRLDKPEQPFKAKANKRQAVSRACNNCRKIKCKCDGIRPTCAKCLERSTNCVYDTEEGISRTASLRNTNDFLTARMGKYEETFDELLANNPSPDTIALINALRLAKGPNVNRKDSASEQSEQSPEFLIHSPNVDRGNRAYSHINGREDHAPNHRSGTSPRSTRQDSFAAPNSSTKWLIGGYNPNDGRVSGKQTGWHPILIINLSERVDGVDIMETMHDHERQPNVYIEKQMKALLHEAPSFDAGMPFPPSKRVRISGPEDDLAEEQLPIHEDLWQYHHANDRDFYPPPGAVTGYGNLPMSSSILTNGYPQTIQRQQVLNFRVPEHTIPPIHVDEASSMSAMYISFKEAALSMIGNGTPVVEILGHHDDPVCVDLLFRTRAVNDSWTADNWACELIKNIGGFDIYVQMAWVALLVKLMRWMVHPTVENYARIPTMIKPIKAQRLIPHSPAIDTCPHPGMRQALMQNYRDWITPGLINNNGGITCWLGSFDQAIIMCNVTGHFLLRPEFEQFTQVSEHWEYPSTIHRTFPEAPEYELKTRGGGGTEWNSYGERPMNSGSTANITRGSGNIDVAADNKSSGYADQIELGQTILEHKRMTHEYEGLRKEKYPPDVFFSNKPQRKKVYTEYMPADPSDQIL